MYTALNKALRRMQRATGHLPCVGVIAVFEIGPLAPPGPEAWPALSFTCSLQSTESAAGWGSEGRELAKTEFHSVCLHNCL